MRTLQETIINEIRKALAKTNGRVIPAAKLLAVPKTTLYKWLERHAINWREYKEKAQEPAPVVAQDAVESEAHVG